MNYKKFAITICSLLIISAAKAQQTPAEAIADKIAAKMKDSLSLTETQRGLLYAVNMQLYSLKHNARQQYANSDSLTIKIQAVENMRDSLYNAVLTEQQFDQYRQKKTRLVNNN